jgi:glycosyltransferase involved in cell wall biosynthesis
MTLKFSIIIPCYNDGIYALEAIDSCLQQKFPAHEIILIDDGSTDNSQDLASNRFAGEPRVKIISKPNGGLSSARNHGINHATGDFIVFLDSDDQIAPGFLSAASEIISSASEKNNLLVISPFKFFADSEEHHERVIKKKRLRPPLLTRLNFLNYLLVLSSNRFPVSSCIVARKLVDKTGNFDENMRSLEDWDYWIRLISLHPQVRYMPFLSDASTHIRVREGMMANTERMRHSRQHIRDKHWHGPASWLLKAPLISPLVRALIKFLSSIQRNIFFGKINLT